MDDLTLLLRDAFLAGRGLKGGDYLSEDDKRQWATYECGLPYVYKRVKATLAEKPAPKSEKEEILDSIAAVMEGEGYVHMTNARGVKSVIDDLNGLSDALGKAEARIDRMRRALTPFANCIFNDNGDITVSPRPFTSEELINAYFAARTGEGRS